MLRALVTGDFHICDKYDLEQIKRLLNVVVVEANKRDELFILGDVFHNSKITPTELYTFIEFLNKITVPIVLISGNHDIARGESILDWIPSVFKNITYSKNTMRVAREDVNILLGHFDVEESVLGAYDFRLNSGISVNTLDVPLALVGHIHKSQNVQGLITQLVHPGSLFYIDMAERNDTKVLVDLTVDGSTYKIDRIKLDPDPIVQIDITPETEGSILKEYPTNCRVKLIVHYSDANLDKKSILRKFDPYMFKDKKIAFVYESPLETSQQVGVQLQELAKYLEDNTTKEVADLITLMVQEE